MYGDNKTIAAKTNEGWQVGEESNKIDATFPSQSRSKLNK